jgi:3',5'-cyclic-nucleotide phosphodiesterase
VAKLRQLHETSLMDSIPIIVLIDIPHDDPRDRRNLRTPSPPVSRRVDSNGDEGTQEPFYGMALLQWISSDMQQNNLSKLVVPVALAPVPEQEEAWPLRSPDLSQTTSVHLPIDQALIISYLDVGATDVLTSPIRRERIPSLAVHAYRAHREALKDHELLLQSKRGRKRSWVGLDDAKPYAYLREAMVSGLMDGICKSGEEEISTSHRRDSLPDMRHDEIVASISSWSFSAHDFTDDELLYAALLMLQHALSMPELEAWRISAGLYCFTLIMCLC